MRDVLQREVKSRYMMNVPLSPRRIEGRHMEERGEDVEESLSLIAAVKPEFEVGQLGLFVM